MAQNRVDKLTGSLDLLDDVLYRIKQAESNEMVCNLSLCFTVSHRFEKYMCSRIS